MILFHGDCTSILNVPDWSVNTIFMDPPDNLGLKYVGYTDKRPDYYEWLAQIIHAAKRHCKTLWISYFYAHDLEISKIIERYPWRKIIWRFAFGQYHEHDHPSGFRFLLRLGAPGNIGAYRVASARMLLGDKRATGPRILDDVWEIPRIVGNAKERRAWHETQHPEELYNRIGAFANHQVLDLFAGSGTCFRAKWLGGCEISDFYVKKIQEENTVRVLTDPQEFVNVITQWPRK